VSKPSAASIVGTERPYRLSMSAGRNRVLTRSRLPTTTSSLRDASPRTPGQRGLIGAPSASTHPGTRLASLTQCVSVAPSLQASRSALDPTNPGRLACHKLCQYLCQELCHNLCQRPRKSRRAGTTQPLRDNCSSGSQTSDRLVRRARIPFATLSPRAGRPARAEPCDGTPLAQDRWASFNELSSCQIPPIREFSCCSTSSRSRR
jgi:hypothetical protein